jgi:hypothetical protein
MGKVKRDPAGASRLFELFPAADDEAADHVVERRQTWGVKFMDGVS